MDKTQFKMAARLHKHGYNSVSFTDTDQWFGLIPAETDPEHIH